MSFPGSILLDQGDIYKITSDKRHPLGTRGYTRDGRVFRYAKAGSTALLMGYVQQQAAEDTDYNFNLNPATSTAPATASTAITLELATAATIAEDEIKEGFLWCNDGTGDLQYVQIEGNTANAGAATGTFDVYIMEGDSFTVAPTTASEFGCHKNKYDDVVICDTCAAHTGAPVGVAVRAVTASYYCWLQTWGPCPVMSVGTPTIGDPVFIDSGSATGTTGAVHPVTTSTAVPETDGSAGFDSVGVCLGVGAGSGETCLVDLKISP